jgi:4-aminobutyrate aminotransferase-like enzyme
MESLAGTHSCIGDIRGTGFFLALELVSDRDKRIPDRELADRIVNALRDRGVLTGSIGPDDNILKFRPPMVLSERDADYMLEVLAETLRATN